MFFFDDENVMLGQRVSILVEFSVPICRLRLDVRYVVLPLRYEEFCPEWYVVLMILAKIVHYAG